MNPIYIIAFVILVLAAALPIICLIKMHMVKRFQDKAIATTAKIFNVEKRRGHRSTYYIIKIRYKTIDTGIDYTGQTVFGNKNKVGEEVSIWYKADDPAVFKTDTAKWMRWVLVFSLLFFALICWLSFWLLNQTYSYGRSNFTLSGYCSHYISLSILSYLQVAGIKDISAIKLKAI